jgi:hypothetical protein
MEETNLPCTADHLQNEAEVLENWKRIAPSDPISAKRTPS